MQSKLLKLYRDARTIEEEQGVSVLFFALGFLRLNESESSQVERFAPLILLPVDLSQESSRGRFKLSYRDQDIEQNPALAAMLKNDFGLLLPDLPSGSEWLPSDYVGRVRSAVSSQSCWQVLPDTINLSFFSFAKFMMWRDLSAESEWADGEGLNGNPLIERLLVGGASSSGSVTAPDENLDKRFQDPRDLGHILDADTSQTQVIAAACDGRDMVVQGPPGTGKSQTIANIIAAVSKAGKCVLFVAEKRARRGPYPLGEVRSRAAVLGTAFALGKSQACIRGLEEDSGSWSSEHRRRRPLRGSAGGPGRVEPDVGADARGRPAHGGHAVPDHGRAFGSDGAGPSAPRLPNRGIRVVGSRPSSGAHGSHGESGIADETVR